MKNLHLNNSSKSKQSIQVFAYDVLKAIMQDKDKLVIFSVDDGDGDVWTYELNIDVKHLKEISHIKEK